MSLYAHYSKKRTTSWVGFKVHLTETCEQDSPHLITHVETTTAPVTDDARTTTIHEGLKQKDLLPEQHIVDTGYVDAQLLHSSQQDYGIDLVGPTHPDVKWQAQQKTGFEAGQFAIDWQAQQAICPEGHTSISWTPAMDNRTNEGDLDQVLQQGLSTLSQSPDVVPTPRVTRVVPSPCAGSSRIKHYSAPEHVPRLRNSKHAMLRALE